MSGVSENSLRNLSALRLKKGQNWKTLAPGKKARRAAITNPNKMALGRFLNAKPDMKTRKFFKRVGYDVSNNKNSDAIVMQLPFLAFSPETYDETRYLAAREFFARCGYDKRITRREGRYHNRPAKFTEDMFFALGKKERLSFGPGLDREEKIKRAVLSLGAAAMHEDPRKDMSRIFAIQEVLDRIEGSPDSIHRDTHFILTSKQKIAALRKIEEMDMAKTNGNGNMKSKTGLLAFAPSDKVQTVSNQHVRLPSDVAREFSQTNTPNEILEQLRGEGLPVAGGTLLEDLVAACGFLGMVAPLQYREKFMKLFCEMMEPKVVPNNQFNTQFNISLDAQRDDDAISKVRALLDAEDV